MHFIEKFFAANHNQLYSLSIVDFSPKAVAHSEKALCIWETLL